MFLYLYDAYDIIQCIYYTEFHFDRLTNEIHTFGFSNIIWTVEKILLAVSCQMWKSWTLTMSGKWLSSSTFRTSILIVSGIVCNSMRQLSFTKNLLKLHFIVIEVTFIITLLNFCITSRIRYEFICLLPNYVTIIF